MSVKPDVVGLLDGLSVGPGCKVCGNNPDTIAAIRRTVDRGVSPRAVAAALNVHRDTFIRCFKAHVNV